MLTSSDSVLVYLFAELSLITLAFSSVADGKISDTVIVNLLGASVGTYDDYLSLRDRI
jgi:hypothetical protein